MNTGSAIKVSLIAPCGMNCGACLAFLREKNKCRGCSESYKNRPITRTRCKIKNCGKLRKSGEKYCLSCEGWPCDRLKHLDKRYRTKYNMSMLENLAFIRQHGIRRFVRKENARWKCPACGGIICIHRGYCYSCGKKR